MNRVAFVLLVLLASGSRINAQGTFPEPTYIRNVGDLASWNIRILQKASSREAGGGKDAPDAYSAPSKVLVELQIDKMGANRREKKTWSDGTSSEVWKHDGIMLVSDPQTKKIFAMFNDRMSTIQKTAISSYVEGNDFPEFSWIGKESLVGFEVKNGRECWKFEKHESAVQPESDFHVEPATAWVDVEKRQPVMIETANEERKVIFVDPRKPELPQLFREAYIKFKEAAKD